MGDAMSAPLEIRLRNMRCVKLSAFHGPSTARTGGKLVSSVASGFTQTDVPCTADGFVTISAQGVPAEATGNDDFSFVIETKVTGRFQWKADTAAPDLNDKDFANSQLQSLYVFGVAVVKELGLRMGYSGLNLYWDLRRHGDPVNETKPSAKSTSPTENTKKVSRPKIIPPKKKRASSS